MRRSCVIPLSQIILPLQSGEKKIAMGSRILFATTSKLGKLQFVMIRIVPCFPCHLEMSLWIQARAPSPQRNPNPPVSARSSRLPPARMRCQRNPKPPAPATSCLRMPTDRPRLRTLILRSGGCPHVLTICRIVCRKLYSSCHRTVWLLFCDFEASIRHTKVSATTLLFTRNPHSAVFIH